MFSKFQKKASTVEGSEGNQSFDFDNNNNKLDIKSNNDNQLSGSDKQFIIEEEEELSLSDNSASIFNNDSKISDVHYTPNANNNNFSQLCSNDFIDSSEFSILKEEIQHRFDIQPNMKLPIAVEYSLGAISDRTDFGCKTIHSNVEELSALTEEIIQKSKECRHLISRLNEYTIKVSKELRTTQQSIRQIKVPRRSLLQLCMLFLVWLIDLFISIYHRIESRNRAINNS